MPLYFCCDVTHKRKLLLRPFPQEPPLNNNLQRANDKRRQLAEGYAREMNQGGAQMLRLEDDYDDREIATAIEDPFISQRDLRVRRTLKP